jgi:hypothetical protein
MVDLDNRIVVRLDPRIEFERELLAAYRDVPRSRRQEWLRALLRRAVTAMNEGIEGVAAVVSSPAAPVAAPVTQATKPPAPAVAAAAQALKAEGKGVSGNAGGTVSAPPSVEESLRGFFPK